MIDERDREHHNSMLNRLEIMRDALDPFHQGRGRVAGMVGTILALNEEIGLHLSTAWAAANDPRWQVPKFASFLAQRHAELAFGYSLVQVAYDELCSYGVIPKDMRSEQTTLDVVAEMVAAEKAANKKLPRASRKKAA